MAAANRGMAAASGMVSWSYQQIMARLLA